MRKLLLALALTGALVGCRGQVGDEDAIRSLIESDPLFNILGVIDGQPETTSVLVAGPQNWYRKIYRDSVVRTYTINVVGDSAYVVAKWHLVGEFRVITGYDTAGDTLTYVAKPLYDVAERHAVFRKAHGRWHLTRITGLKVYPQSGTPAFTVDSVVVIGSSSGRKVFTDPLTFLDTAHIFYSPGESLEVRAYVRPADTVFGYIHHWKGRHHRDAMDYDITAGYLVRTYTLTTRPGRYNAIADFLQRESLDPSSTLYLSVAWGFPYIVR